MRDINMRIVKTEEEIKQLQIKKKKLLNQQKNEERKARTRRLTERGAILESFLNQPEHYQNEQIKRLLEIALQTVQAQEYLLKIESGMEKDETPLF